MNTSEKTQFVVESLAKAMDSHKTHFMKENKKLFKPKDDSRDFQKITNLMSVAIFESIKVMGEWEETNFYELDGMSPKQYFESL